MRFLQSLPLPPSVVTPSTKEFCEKQVMIRAPLMLIPQGGPDTERMLLDLGAPQRCSRSRGVSLLCIHTQEQPGSATTQGSSVLPKPGTVRVSWASGVPSAGPCCAFCKSCPVPGFGSSSSKGESRAGESQESWALPTPVIHGNEK